jgi:hypothetical protein
LNYHHKDRGNRSLVHEQPPVPNEYGHRPGDGDHHRYLHRPDADGAHDEICDREPDGDPKATSRARLPR